MTSSSATFSFSASVLLLPPPGRSRLVVDPLKSERNENRSADMPCLCRLTLLATEGGLAEASLGVALDFFALGVASTAGWAGGAGSDSTGIEGAVWMALGEPEDLRFLGVEFEGDGEATTGGVEGNGMGTRGGVEERMGTFSIMVGGIEVGRFAEGSVVAPGSATLTSRKEQSAPQNEEAQSGIRSSPAPAINSDSTGDITTSSCSFNAGSSTKLSDTGNAVSTGSNCLAAALLCAPPSYSTCTVALLAFFLLSLSASSALCVSSAGEGGRGLTLDLLDLVPLAGVPASIAVALEGVLDLVTPPSVDASNMVWSS